MNDTIEKFGIFAISVLPRRWWINVRQRFSWTAEWNFMKLLPNDSGENGVSIPVYGFTGSRFCITSRLLTAQCYAGARLFVYTADALRRHERVNAFNLIYSMNFDQNWLQTIAKSINTVPRVDNTPKFVWEWHTAFAPTLQKERKMSIYFGT